MLVDNDLIVEIQLAIRCTRQAVLAPSILPCRHHYKLRAVSEGPFHADPYKTNMNPIRSVSIWPIRLKNQLAKTNGVNFDYVHCPSTATRTAPWTDIKPIPHRYRCECCRKRCEKPTRRPTSSFSTQARRTARSGPSSPNETLSLIGGACPRTGWLPTQWPAWEPPGFEPFRRALHRCKGGEIR